MAGHSALDKAGPDHSAARGSWRLVGQSPSLAREALACGTEDHVQALRRRLQDLRSFPSWLRCPAPARAHDAASCSLAQPVRRARQLAEALLGRARPSAEPALGG